VVSENEDRHFFNCDFEYSEEGASPVKITIKKQKDKMNYDRFIFLGNLLSSLKYSIIDSEQVL